MKRLLLLLLALPLLAHAQVDKTVRIQMFNGPMGFFQARDVPPPAGSVDGLLIFNASTGLPDYLTLGSGLSIASGVLSAAGGGSVNCAAITDSTATGCSVLTAANAAAARAAIGAGTSSFSGAYSDLGGKPTTLAGYGITDAYPLSGNPSGFLTSINSGQITGALGYMPYNATNPSGYRTQAQVRADISLTTTGTGAATYDPLTGALNVPTPASAPARSFSYATRALNTCFQVSATRDALVTYSVDIATTLTLLAGQQGTVYLEIFTNSICTAGTQEVTRFVNGQTGALTVGLSLQQNVTATLTGVIPAGSYVRMRTENNTGSPAFTARPGQETLL